SPCVWWINPGPVLARDPPEAVPERSTAMTRTGTRAGVGDAPAGTRRAMPPVTGRAPGDPRRPRATRRRTAPGPLGGHARLAVSDGAPGAAEGTRGQIGGVVVAE